MDTIPTIIHDYIEHVKIYARADIESVRCMNYIEKTLRRLYATERICKELAGVRDAADRVMNTRFDSPAKGEQHEYLSNLHDEEDALVELLDSLSPEARDYK